MFGLWVFIIWMIVLLACLLINEHRHLRELERAVYYMGMRPEDLINRSNNIKSIDFLLAEAEGNSKQE